MRTDVVEDISEKEIWVLRDRGKRTQAIERTLSSGKLKQAFERMIQVRKMWLHRLDMFFNLPVGYVFGGLAWAGVLLMRGGGDDRGLGQGL